MTDRQLHHLSALVDDLLDVTRIGNGQLAMKRSPDELADARRRIVVADDDEDVLQALAMLLDSMGHEVWLARSGSEAIARSLAVQPDLLLLDLSMPDIGGVEVARRLRATLAGDELRIGALTGHCQPADHDRTRAAGFDWHFRKPVTGAALGEVIARLPARQGPPDA